MTWAACTGHPAAPNASKQELSNKGGNLLFLPPWHQLGA